MLSLHISFASATNEDKNRCGSFPPFSPLTRKSLSCPLRLRSPAGGKTLEPPDKKNLMYWQNRGQGLLTRSLSEAEEEEGKRWWGQIDIYARSHRKRRKAKAAQYIRVIFPWSFPLSVSQHIFFSHLFRRRRQVCEENGPPQMKGAFIKPATRWKLLNNYCTYIHTSVHAHTHTLDAHTGCHGKEEIFIIYKEMFIIY